MISPASLMGAFLVIGVGASIAGALLWRNQRPVYWFALALILVGTGYLMATGATEDIARSVWPAAFNPGQRREIESLWRRDHEKWLGALLLIAPFWAALAWVSWRRRAVPLIPAVLLVALQIFLFASPMSARFARLVLPDHILNAPAEQTKARQQQ